MKNILPIQQKEDLGSFRNLILSSICLVPIAALSSTPAHAQLVNTATVTGTPDAGTLTDATATESVDIYEPIDAQPESFPAIKFTEILVDLLNFSNDRRKTPDVVAKSFVQIRKQFRIRLPGVVTGTEHAWKEDFDLFFCGFL